MRRHSVGQGALAGLVAGLAASWFMTQFQNAMREMQEPQTSSAAGDGEPATVKAAEAVMELKPEQKPAAGTAIHYLMGGVSGAIYGAACETLPLASTGAGTLFGTVLWFAADEIAVPGLGLSKDPKEYPAPVHMNALAAHCVYGWTTDLFRRGLLLAMGSEKKS